MHAAYALLAQAESTQFKFLFVAGTILLTIVLPFLLGRFLANRLRMSGHDWKIGVVLAATALSCFIVARTWNPDEQRFEFKLGVDLKGGVILIYEVDENAPLPGDESADNPDARFSMAALVEALSRRINPSGTKEIVIRPYGDRQVEIIIPEVDQREVELIKKGISTAGVLQFRIVGTARDHEQAMSLATEMARDPIKRRGRLVRDAEGETVGLWARVAREQRDVGGIRPFKLAVGNHLLRDASTGEILEVPPEFRNADPEQLAQWVAEQEIRDIDVLMGMDDGYDVTGAHLGAISRGVDEYLRPSINFNLQGEGVARFAGLTREFAPQGQFERRLGILLDNELLSAPNIQEAIDQGRGRITGQFTQEEVDFLVNILQAGSLPVVLNKIPISENQIDPLLGAETIEQGKYAMGISLVMVLIFIAIYYRFAGLVASMALLLNLLFILALMVLIKAAFTLPGLAGLVLTVGMSVDANVLIFERIREELHRGSALRMAIRNGFGRATRTIVDANLTTLITALVLYGIGTDQIRGFAVTLILGILMSMFTAIFCSRIVFDIAERTRSISKLTMTELLRATQIDFIGKRRVAAVMSLIVIGVGTTGIFVRGLDIFDIDFRGGTSVHVRFKESVDTELVRGQLEKQFAGTNVRYTITAMNNTAGATEQNTFKVDTSLEEVTDLQQAMRDAFSDGTFALATYAFDYQDLQTVTVELPSSVPEDVDGANSADAVGDDTTVESAEPGNAEAVPAEKNGVEATAPPEAPATSPAPGEGARRDLPTNNQLARADEVPGLLLAQAEEAGPTTDANEEAVGDSEPESGDSETEYQAETATQIEVKLAFEQAINADTLSGKIEEAAERLDIPVSYFEVIHPLWDGESSNAFNEWTLRISATESQTRQLLDDLKSEFAETPVWPSSSKIGSQVAGHMQSKAIAALATSLLGIIVYIWVRFQHVVFGLAAVVALVHDVMVTLGAIAVSAWLADIFGFLLIEEFKISLPIVAALLTIIGYSLNDTIVVFDRIREVRGKSPHLTAEMINTSINQTLGRTVLTSVTTLLVVVVLYAIGGEGIHGFAYSLMIGVVVGTYSSMFVASPVLLWMAGERTSTSKKSAAA